MVPFVLEEIFITQANETKQNIKHEKSLKNVVQNEKSFRSCQKQNNAIDKSKQYKKITDDLVPSAFDYLFESEVSVYKISELYPNLDVIVFWGEHVRLFG
jgi:hypothetical protein